jgi:hypothetical protein
MQPNQTSIPTAVLRKWKAAFEPEVPKEPRPTLKDVNVDLAVEVRLAARQPSGLRW